MKARYIHNKKSSVADTSPLNKFYALHLNIQSLRNKMLLFEALVINDLPYLDIICLSEHWLSESETASLRISNFIVAESFSRS